MIDFGHRPGSADHVTGPTTYSSGTQSLTHLGLGHDERTTLSAAVKYATLTGRRTITTARLTAQTIRCLSSAAGTTPATRTVSNNTVCWQERPPAAAAITTGLE